LAATKRYTRQAEREGTEGRGQRGPRGRRRRAAFTVVGLKMLGDRQRGEEERYPWPPVATDTDRPVAALGENVRPQGRRREAGAVGAGGVGTLKEGGSVRRHQDTCYGQGLGHDRGRAAAALQPPHQSSVPK
jgi:hypothetical protein